MQRHRAGYTIDTRRERLPMEIIVGWLGTTYWAATRPPEAIRRSWDNSPVVFGLYCGEEIAGWARVVTDSVAIAYLADVFLVPEHRGRGLGLWLVETIVAHPELSGVRWLLHTDDAHGLYRRVGFTEVDAARVLERPRPAPPR